MTKSRFILASLLVIFCTHSASGQAYPPISARTFKSGSVKVVVTGSFSVNTDVPLNTQASISDGEMTWLQFGVSGSNAPEALITYGENKETGVTVGSGKQVATGGMMPGEKPTCSGKVEVTPTLISGHYVCKGLTSHNALGGTLGKVDVEVTFTARS